MPGCSGPSWADTLCECYWLEEHAADGRETVYEVKQGREVESRIWDEKPRRLSEVWKLEREPGTVVVLGLEGVVSLSAMGSAIWLMLDGEHTVGTVVEALAKAYPSVDERRIQADVVSFINDMVVGRLVTLDWCPL
jgi:hypothetical protein